MTELTDMEREIFKRCFDLYEEHGFPTAESIHVNTRVEDCVGRYTHVAHAGKLSFRSGTLSAGDHCHIDVDELVTGLYFEIFCEEFKVVTLHIFSVGLVDWSGAEAGWKII